MEIARIVYFSKNQIYLLKIFLLQLYTERNYLHTEFYNFGIDVGMYSNDIL